MKIYVNNIFKVKKQRKNKKEDIKEMPEKIINEDEKVEVNKENKIKKFEENIKKNKYIRKGAADNNLKVDFINIKNHVFKKTKLPKSYYALLVLMIGLAGISLKLVRDTKDYYSLEEDYAVFNSNDEVLEEESIKESDLQDEESSNLDTREEVVVSSVSSNNVINQFQEKIDNIVEKKEEPLVFAKPYHGEISKIFSNDKVIYSKTLEMWKTHDGIDIKGEIGDVVYSVERGTVEKVYEDAFYGVTIVINHGQGYKTSYSNLSEDIFVNEGDTVKKLQKIGKVGTTAIGEIKDEPHLHFMLYENDIVADPTSIFE